MSEPVLPPELAELERELMHARAAASPMLAESVLRSVRAELIDERRAQGRRMALAAAAVVLVGLHLSWWGAQPSSFSRGTPIEPAQVAARAELMRAIVPELSVAEAGRQARLALLYSNRDVSLRPAPFALPRPYAADEFLD